MASPGPRSRADTNAIPEVWAGVECATVRVGRRLVDQIALTGHDKRDGDLDALASLGVAAVRYPVLWEHIYARANSDPDWSWADARLGRLRELGVRPVVGLLHHGSGPVGMSILSRNFAEAFAQFAGEVAQRYPWIDAYVPINEPLTTARFGGLYGWWQPHRHSIDVCLHMLLAQCNAIRAATTAIKAANPDAQVIVNEDVGRTFSTEPLSALAAELNERRWLTWDVLTGRLTRDHPYFSRLVGTKENERLVASLSDEPLAPDILGIDHYVTSDRFLDHRVARYIPVRSAASAPPYIDVEACRVPGIPIGSVSRAVAETWQRYGRPIALTEISLAGSAHDQISWWNEAWLAARHARRAGTDVRAVTAWAAYGAVDWHNLMRRAEGLYEPGVFDVRSGLPVEQPVARAIRSCAQTGRLARRSRKRATGWWNSPDRYTLKVRSAIEHAA